MIFRLAALLLIASLAAFPLTILAAPPITWLAVAAVLAAGVGVLAPSLRLVTIGGVLALIAYALAIVMTRAATDVVAAIAFGATLVLVLALTHFAGRIDGAALGAGVVAGQLRQWLAVVAAGVLVALLFAAAAAGLGTLLAGATLPIVVIAAALGAALTLAGVIALVTAPNRS
jgi:hypothetical protein